MPDGRQVPSLSTSISIPSILLRLLVAFSLQLVQQFQRGLRHYNNSHLAAKVHQVVYCPLRVRILVNRNNVMQFRIIINNGVLFIRVNDKHSYIIKVNPIFSKYCSDSEVNFKIHKLFSHSFV